MIFKIVKPEGKKEEIDVHKTMDIGTSYSDFTEALIEAGAGYGVYDYHKTLDDGRCIKKIVFFSWVPDDAKMKERMLVGATCESFKGQLEGVRTCIQATDV